MEPDDAVVQDSQVYFILEKYIITIHFWNHKNNHGTDVLTTHALSGFYNRYVFGFCGNMKRKQVSVNLVLKWNVLMHAEWAWCKLKLQCKGDPYNGIKRLTFTAMLKIAEVVRRIIFLFRLNLPQMYYLWSKVFSPFQRI
jgi:hypothetical protein